MIWDLAVLYRGSEFQEVVAAGADDVFSAGPARGLTLGHLVVTPWPRYPHLVVVGVALDGSSFLGRAADGELVDVDAEGVLTGYASVADWELGVVA